MLGKLLKYDMKDTLKGMLPVYIILLLFSVMIKILNVVAEDVEFLKYVALFTTILWVSIIVVGLIYCFFLTIKNYYQKVLKDEGYLTNTLPTGKGSIVASKLITGIISMIVSILVVLGSLLIVFYQKDLFTQIGNFIQSIMPNADYNVGGIFALLGAVLLLGYIAAINIVNCALTIGHSFSKSKISYSVVTGVIIYFIYQILNILGFAVLFLFHQDLLQNMEQNAVPFEIFIQIFMISIISTIVINVVCYVGTYIGLKNKLNLE